MTASLQNRHYAKLPSYGGVCTIYRLYVPFTPLSLCSLFNSISLVCRENITLDNYPSAIVILGHDVSLTMVNRLDSRVLVSGHLHKRRCKSINGVQLSASTTQKVVWAFILNPNR